VFAAKSVSLQANEDKNTPISDKKNGIIQEFRIPNSTEFLGFQKKKCFDLFIPMNADEILHSLKNHFIRAHFVR
jgi:hypothetical protein